MISGPRSRLSEVLLAAACLVLSDTAIAGDIGAKALMALLASVSSVRAHFVETRYSALLKVPLVSRGTLVYERPDRMVKHTVAPHEERIVLEAGHLSIESPALGSKTEATLSRNPDVAALVESIRATRAGDLAELNRHFEVSVSGVRAEWRIVLLPRAPDLAEYVDSITIAGHGARIARIEVREASGDRTVTEIDEELE